MADEVAPRDSRVKIEVLQTALFDEPAAGADIEAPVVVRVPHACKNYENVNKLRRSLMKARPALYRSQQSASQLKLSSFSRHCALDDQTVAASQLAEHPTDYAEVTFDRSKPNFESRTQQDSNFQQEYSFGSGIPAGSWQVLTDGKVVELDGPVNSQPQRSSTQCSEQGRISIQSVASKQAKLRAARTKIASSTAGSQRSLGKSLCNSKKQAKI